MRVEAIAIIILATSVADGRPAQFDPVTHAPVARWVVDFADNQCLASLSFGDTKNPLFLALKPSPAGQIMQVLVVKRTGSFESPAQLPVTIKIGDEPPRQFSMLAVSGKQGGPANFRINLSLDDFAPMRKATQVSIVSGQKLNETFKLVQMAPLLKAMDECIADLRRFWNIDPPYQSKLRSRAKANLVSLFSTNDYPGVSIQKREGGLVGMVLLIDERGKVADCMVTQTSNYAALDTQACAIVMTRGKYSPAIDENGKPARDSDNARIRWETP